MNIRILALALTGLALIGCATSEQPGPAAEPTATSTLGAWEVNLNLVNQVGAVGRASFTFADGRTRIIEFAENAEDLTEKDLVLVGQGVTVEVDVTKPPTDGYVVCTISAPKFTVATEGGGTLDSNTGTGTFSCSWANDGTVVMPEPED